MDAVDRSFFIRGDDGTEYGPVELTELREWVRENRAGLGTLVKADEPESGWKLWQEFPELVVLLAELQSRGPVATRPDLVYAPFIRRLAAAILDLTFALILFFPVSMIYLTTLPPSSQETIFLFGLRPDSFNVKDDAIPPEVDNFKVLFFALGVVYLTSFVTAHGKTPGKALLGLKVISEDGGLPSMGQSLKRALVFIILLAYILANPKLLPIVGPLYFYINLQKRSFHDYWARTFVVKG